MHFSDSDEDDQAPKVVALTEFSSATLEKAPEVVKSIPRLENTFRNGSASYRPDALSSKKVQGGKSIAELEAAERNRTQAYGLSRPARESVIETETAGDTDDERQAQPKIKEESLTEQELAVRELLNPTELKEEFSIKQEADDKSFLRRPRFAADRPAMSTLDEYQEVPVEEFGLAMLRGMGYVPPTKDKEETKKIERRADFLGLGAMERPEDTKTAADLRKNKHQRKIEQKMYVPVVKRNKRTGEIIEDSPGSSRLASEEPSSTNRDPRRSSAARTIEQDGSRHRRRSRERSPDRDRDRYRSHDGRDRNRGDRVRDDRPDGRHRGSSDRDYRRRVHAYN